MEYHSCIATVFVVLFALLGLGIAVYDVRTGFIPDLLSIPFLLIALMHSVATETWPFYGMLVGGGFFAIQYFVSRGKWVGSGDIIVGTAIGAFLTGVPLTLVALVVAYVSAAACVMLLLVRKWKTSEGRIVFAPFLIFGAAVAFMWGEQLLQIYVTG